MFKFIANLSIVFILLVVHQVQAQLDVPQNWYLLDKQTSGFPGISADKAYENLLKGKKSKKVIVAILDSGVEDKHEDLKDNMWVNEDEIPNNGKDDDHNGYIDDIHGWNFLGGKNGQNVAAETFESTRQYKKLKYKYENADPKKITSAQKKEYKLFLKYKEEVDNRRRAAQNVLDEIEKTETPVNLALAELKKQLNGKALSTNNLDSIDAGDNQLLAIAVAIVKSILSEISDIKTMDQLEKFIADDFAAAKADSKKELEYNFNPDYNSRLIVGDDENNINQKDYGNADVQGPDAMHGSHVAGVIGATRNNGIGIVGIADNVQIMSVRCVPDGDERDKDVANAIRYAVDNGANIINMSFGKGFSPNKDAVDDAVKYAAAKDVLIVAGAGNGSADIDKVANFPNPNYAKKKFLKCNTAQNWIEVGASSFQNGADITAEFSNYGKKSVDIFSPGVLIYSTVPTSEYKNLQGTSMASPIAAGVAAVLRSYYPNLSAKQIKKIMIKSCMPITDKVKVPATEKLVSMKKLCRSGGIVNLYNAVVLAEKS